MRYSTNEFSGISSILKIDLKLFAIVMIIVFLGMITLFSVSRVIARDAQTRHKDPNWTSCYDFTGTDPS